jgi:hypothetical protein
VSPQRKIVLVGRRASALRLSNAAALFERLRSFHAGVVLAAQSIEGLHDDPAERTRLLNSASTLIAHRLADPDPIVTRAGTIRRAERSHQLDVDGATGMGSLRLQDAYRVDPNDLRSLATGVAYVVTGGRAAKVAVAAARATTLAGSALPRRGTPPSSAPPEADRHAELQLDVAACSQGRCTSDADATGEPKVDSDVEAGAVPGSDHQTAQGDETSPTAGRPATKSSVSPYAQGL